MRRGPPPTKGFGIALPIALMRGRVMLFQQVPEHVCDFTITGNGIFALVRLMSATRLHAAIAEITRHYSDTVAGLSTIPFGGPVSRELWLYSRYGTLRYFRVAEAGLVEIDSNGFLFMNGKPVSALPANPSVNPYGSGPAVLEQGDPCPAEKAVTIPPGSGSLNPKNPVISSAGKNYSSKKTGPEENDPSSSIDPALQQKCTHKKPALAMNPVPTDEAVILVGDPVSDGQVGLPCDESLLAKQDILPSSGKSDGEK